MTIKGITVPKLYQDYGVDFDIEVNVARLSFYEITDIDTCLQNAIDYQTTDLSSSQGTAYF